MKQLVTASDAADLNRFAAEKIVEIISAAGDRSVALALSGGSTPRSLYQLLAEREFAPKLPLKRLYFFIGDERLVPPNSEESNFRMASEALFGPMGIDESHAFRWRTELGQPEQIADDYAARLEQFFGPAPVFDLVLLGLGGDGHTASLFPNTAALSEMERPAAANWVPKLDAWRVTLTFPVINNAANVIFLVSGAAKAPIVKDVLEGPFDPDRLPAQMVQPFRGNLLWLVDREAAGMLDNKAFAIHN